MDIQWTDFQHRLVLKERQRKEGEVRQGIFTVTANRSLGPGLYRMDLAGDTREIRADGGFVDLSVPGKYLRRPISVYRVLPGLVSIVYKVAGSGTALMSEWTPGTRADLLSGLGRGYEASLAGEKPLLAGGGYGAASLYGLARTLALAGKKPSVILGFDRAQDAGFLADFIDLMDLGATVRLVTRDGSAGARGLVTDLIGTDEGEKSTFLYACGPLPMLRALADQTGGLPGQFSLEARMGCGFGACMGCTVMTTRGPVRVCKEGPVFDKGEILWTQG